MAKVKNFVTYFGTNDKEKLKQRSAEAVIEFSNNRTHVEAQSELKEAGAIKTIDVSKHSSWVNGKRLPENSVQIYIVAHLERKSANEVTGEKYGFEIPEALEAVREVGYSGMHDNALVIIDKCLHFTNPDHKALTVLVAAGIYRLKRSYKTARKKISTIDATTVRDMKLRMAIENFTIGLEFEIAYKMEDEHQSVEKMQAVASDLRMHMQRYPQDQKARRNSLRLYSILGDEDRFTENFAKLYDIADNQATLVNRILDDDDFAKARDFESMQKYFNPVTQPRVNKCLQSGFATIKSLVFVAMVSIAMIGGMGALKHAQAADYMFSYALPFASNHGGRMTTEAEDAAMAEHWTPGGEVTAEAEDAAMAKYWTPGGEVPAEAEVTAMVEYWTPGGEVATEAALAAMMKILSLGGEAAAMAKGWEWDGKAATMAKGWEWDGKAVAITEGWVTEGQSGFLNDI